MFYRCNDLHHEIELGVVLGKQARKVTEDEAMSHVGGYCLALDMTARLSINKKCIEEASHAIEFLWLSQGFPG